MRSVSIILRAWASPTPCPIAVYTLANATDRREVITIDADDGREYLMAFRAIVRPTHGRAYLGKLGEIERPEHTRGRFLDLLPRARPGASGERQ
jgi:hypothetical protein